MNLTPVGPTWLIAVGSLVIICAAFAGLVFGRSLPTSVQRTTAVIAAVALGASGFWLMSESLSGRVVDHYVLDERAVLNGYGSRLVVLDDDLAATLVDRGAHGITRDSRGPYLALTADSGLSLVPCHQRIVSGHESLDCGDSNMWNIPVKRTMTENANSEVLVAIRNGTYDSRPTSGPVTVTYRDSVPTSDDPRLNGRLAVMSAVYPTQTVYTALRNANVTVNGYDGPGSR